MAICACSTNPTGASSQNKASTTAGRFPGVRGQEDASAQIGYGPTGRVAWEPCPEGVSLSPPDKPKNYTAIGPLEAHAVRFYAKHLLRLHHKAMNANQSHQRMNALNNIKWTSSIVADQLTEQMPRSAAIMKQYLECPGGPDNPETYRFTLQELAEENARTAGMLKYLESLAITRAQKAIAYSSADDRVEKQLIKIQADGGGLSFRGERDIKNAFGEANLEATADLLWEGNGPKVRMKVRITDTGDFKIGASTDADPQSRGRIIVGIEHNKPGPGRDEHNRECMAFYIYREVFLALEDNKLACGVPIVVEGERTVSVPTLEEGELP